LRIDRGYKGLMVRVSSRAGVERDLYLCDWNVIARYNTLPGNTTD
jgi:hypothetical protein